MHRTLCVGSALAVVAFGVACSDDATGDVTYHQDVEPMLTEHCAGCHHPDQSAPLDLHTYEKARDKAQVSLSQIESGAMPPWPPDPECREYHDQRVISDEDVETLRAWVEADMPRGQRPDDYEPHSPDDIEEPDRRAAIADPPYHPREDLEDEYRCFLLDEEFEEDTYVTGTHVDTGGVEVIHHANIFMVNPFHEETVQQLEASADESGYPCFGSPGFNSIDLIGAWVPGAQPIFVPDDSAVVIPEGSRMVMQVHFNTLFADPEPVAPEVTLYTREDPPDQRVFAMPFAIMDFLIPAGESDHVVSQTYHNHSDEPWTVLGAAPHMHQLGTEAHMEIVHDDTNSCLIDIPDWDFDWQQAYRFLDDQWVEVSPGDEVRLTCTFDNSADNQPFIDGQQPSPEDVTWGAQSTDEMCMSFLMVIEDYEPGDGTGEMCEAFVECRQEHEDCVDDPFSIGCIFNCGTLENDCGYCLLREAQRCADDHCDEEVDAAMPCLLTCAQGAQTGGDIDGCLEDECPDERDALQNCLQPPMESGQCNVYLERCNVTL